MPVNLNAQFILGSEGAHLNISGISGLAAKTSYAMFLIKSISESFRLNNSNDSVAFVIFNVKGKDLMAIHRPNDDMNNKIAEDYKRLGLSSKPFKNVRYYAPSKAVDKVTTYLPEDTVNQYFNQGILKSFKYTYEDDRESLEMLFADIDDTTQTMDSILSKVIDKDDITFIGAETWDYFLAIVNTLSQSGSGKTNSNEISVFSCASSIV